MLHCCLLLPKTYRQNQLRCVNLNRNASLQVADLTCCALPVVLMDIGSAFVWLASLYFVCDVWQSCLDDVVLLYNNNNNNNADDF